MNMREARELISRSRPFRCLARWLRKAGIHRKRQGPFRNSADYWEERYRSGGTSGAGSYGRLAHFKAEFINRFVEAEAVDSVIEFGCGDGNQLALANYPRYVGVDVSHTIIDRANKRFESFPNISFVHTSLISSDLKFSLSLSLDVIYHLVEDEAFDTYMNCLFDASLAHVIIYSSNKDEQPPVPHVRHRKFTDWVEKNRKDFLLVDHVPNKFPYSVEDPSNTSFADFFVFRRV